MLCKEYFPNENLTMSEELKTAMVHYYDFLTSYQNLLRDGGTENSITMNCTNGEMKLNVWPPQQGSVTTYAKQVGDKQVIHLLNFSQANSLSWRDVAGTGFDYESGFADESAGKGEQAVGSIAGCTRGSFAGAGFYTRERSRFFHFAFSEILDHDCS